jgi:DNA-binding NarL/FixJ family response regulator
MSAAPEAIRVAVVEDNSAQRERIIDLLGNSPGFTCAGSCASGAEALGTLPSLGPEVVLMDIKMEGMSGIACVRALRPLLPKAEFMMLTVVEDHELIFQALCAGASGYLLKKTRSDRLLEHIRELHAGGSPMSSQVARKVLTAFRQQHVLSPEAEKLTLVEQGVLLRLARGLLYKEVADELNIAPGTVRTHIYHIYEKLQVHNRTEAIAKGLQAAPR